MATNVILPALGMAQDSGKIIRWLQAEGESVRAGEFIAEIETDKATVELEAPAAGRLAHLYAAGDEAPVGQPIALILADGEAAPVRAASAPAASVMAPGGDGRGARQSSAAVALQPSAAHGRLGSPKAKRIAAAHGLDIAQITGTGPHGEVLAADVLSAAARADGAGSGAMAATLGVTTSTAANPAPALSRIARLMAERTTQTWTTTPHFFLFRDVEATAFKNWYAQAQKRAAENLTYTDLLVKVVASALRLHPRLNASWQDGAIVTHDDINMGLAVAVPDGLVVPVIPRADDLSLSAIARHRADIVSRAQAGVLRLTDLQGGTFTISNLGMYGIDAFNAIIVSPQAAILAVGALADRVIPVDGRPAVRPMLTLSLSCDHRVVDGAQGARFLATVAELLNDPSGL